MIMATDNILCFDDQVLSDVHVNLSHSDKIYRINDYLKRQHWLSRFHFWLPHVTEEKTRSLGDDYTSAEQTSTCSNNHCATYMSEEKQTHNSIEKQAHNSIEKQAHNSIKKQTHNSIEKQTHNSIEKQTLELDEDGDILLIRRETSSSQDSLADQVHYSSTRNVSHTIECDTNVLLLPLTKSDNSSPKHHIPESSGNVFLESELCSRLLRDTKCGNTADIGMDVRPYRELDTKVVSSCDQKVRSPSQVNENNLSKILNSRHKRHSSLLSENKLGNDADMSHDHGTINQTNLVVSPSEELDVGVLTLEHSLETTLPEVGFQVWSGALLLCDYLIYNRRHLEYSIVLDLGAGTGITSIIAAMFAPCVICTDYLAGVVALCERNWQRNRDLLPRRTCDQICFKILDWMCDWASQDADSKSQYDIMPADLKLIEDATFILAAEVIYDEELTDACFRTIYKLLMTSQPKTVLLTVERRIVFSAENKDICSPAYEHFLENLEDLVTVDEGPVYFTVERMSTAFPQYFQYQRVKELELWQISSHLHELAV